MEAGGICETKRIRSYYLLVDREKRLPNLAPSLCKGAGPRQAIDATISARTRRTAAYCSGGEGFPESPSMRATVSRLVLQKAEPSGSLTSR
jgi:hypothetical protein